MKFGDLKVQVDREKLYTMLNYSDDNKQITKYANKS